MQNKQYKEEFRVRAKKHSHDNIYTVMNLEKSYFLLFEKTRLGLKPLKVFLEIGFNAKYKKDSNWWLCLNHSHCQMLNKQNVDYLYMNTAATEIKKYFWYEAKLKVKYLKINVNKIVFQ